MISAFQVFKIILGIVISAFILMFVINFVGSYMGVGETTRKVSLLLNFKKSVQDVYTTSVATDFDMGESEILRYVAPNIQTGVSSMDVEPIPLIMVPGKELLVSRNEYDIGWWKFYFVQSMPKTRVMFVPLADKEESISMMGNITSFFPPDRNVETRNEFGVGCSEGEFWVGINRKDFLDSAIPSLMASDFVFSVCGEELHERLKGEGYRIVVISHSITGDDFIVEPPQEGIGHVHVKGEDGEYGEYVYKNPMDIVSLLLGGERTYSYMNGKFMDELEAGTGTASREMGLLMGVGNIKNRCGEDIEKFRITLKEISDLIPKLGEGKEKEFIEFTGLLVQSGDEYAELRRMGCV